MKNQNFKRILSLLLCLCLTFSLLHITAIAGGSDDITVVTFDELKREIENFTSSAGDKTITVGSPLVVTSALTVPANSGSTLAITGETLTRGVTGNLITVGNGAKLVLEYITIDGDKNTYSSNNGALVYVNVGGEFTLKDGATLRNNAGGIGYGGGVSALGTFNMSGGEISGNTCAFGGGVGALGAFNMSDGTISGNTAASYGGGVYVDGGTFNMGSGEILSNTAVYNGGVRGGGVYVNDGTINIGGDFTLGDNIYSAKQLNITDNLTLDLNGNALEIEVNEGNGIKIANGKTFAIEDNSEPSTGALTVVNTLSGYDTGNGAGINTTSGKLIINSGTITATGGRGGAAIGGGDGGKGGTIIINGGFVNAKGGSNASDIGAGHEESGGDTRITGGSVFAVNGKIDGFAEGEEGPMMGLEPNAPRYPVKVTVENSSGAKVDGVTVAFGSYTAVTGGNLTSAFDDATKDPGVAWLWLRPNNMGEITASKTPDSGSEDYTTSTSGGAVTITIATPPPALWTTDVTTVTPVGNTYAITTPQELAWVAAQTNSGANNFSGKTVVLANDIDLDGKEWVPIANISGREFRGTFDGRSNVIENMNITSPTGSGFYVGLFGRTLTATIKNVGIVSGAINVTDAEYAAAIAGYVSRGPVRNCYSLISIAHFSPTVNTRAGGIVGNLSDDSSNLGKIENCYSSGTVTASYAGGIVSDTTTYTTVTNCYFLSDTLTKAVNAGAATKTSLGSFSNNGGALTVTDSTTLINGTNLLAALNAGNSEAAYKWIADSNIGGYPKLVPLTPEDRLRKAAAVGGTYTLDCDIKDGDKLTAQLDVNCTSVDSFVLDLNGYNLEITGSSSTGNCIKIANNKTLTIVDSSDPSTGTLTVTNTLSSASGGNGAGINSSSGTLVINGGTVIAAGGGNGAGIGGGFRFAGGTITINGGTVNATGGSGGAGIGGGGEGAGGTVAINGGSIKAVGGSGAENIGNGEYGSGNGTLKNGSGANVYLVTLTVGSTPLANTAVTGITSPGSYDITDVKTDSAGKLYFYLPVGAADISLTAGGKTYAGSLTVGLNHNNTATLTSNTETTYTYTIDFADGRTPPGSGTFSTALSLIQVDENGTESTLAAVFSNVAGGNGHFRRAVIQSESPTLTLKVKWGDNASPNCGVAADGRFVVSADYPHVYLCQGVRAAYYMTGNTETNTVTLTVVKNNNNTDLSYYYAAAYNTSVAGEVTTVGTTGTVKPLTEELTPNGAALSGNWYELSGTSPADTNLTAGAAIWFKLIASLDNTGTGSHSAMAIGGNGASDLSPTGQKNMEFTIGAVTATATPLATVTGATLSAAGQATWTNLSSETGLANYSVQLYKGASPFGSAKTSGTGTGSTGVSFLSEMRTEGAGTYTVKVTAIGNGTTHSSGVASNASSAQTVAKLPTPSTLAWSGSNATFNKLADETNVSKYSVTITGTGKIGGNSTADVSKTGSNLTVAVTSPISGDTFKIKAIALTTGLFLDSDESAASAAYYAAPTYTTTITIPQVNGTDPANTVGNPVAAQAGATVTLPTVTAKAGFAFSSWSVTSGGVTLSAISNTQPTFTMGSANVAVTATFVPTTLTFSNQTLTSGTYGTAYSQTVTAATGGSGTYTYAATVPAGLTMATNGTISGTPNAAITAQTFTVTATDTVSGGTQTATYTLTIGKANFTAAAISLTAPVTGATPSTATTGGTTYTITSTAWSGTPTTFAASTVYTATVTLTAAANYAFGTVSTTSVTGTNGTVTAAVTGSGGATLTVTITYPATLTKTVSSIVIHTPPTVAYTSGDTLNLSGLVVTVTYDDGTNENKAYVDLNGAVFTIDGNTVISGTTVLINAAHGGKPITVTYGGETVDTDDLDIYVPPVVWTRVQTLSYNMAAMKYKLDKGTVKVYDSDGAVVYSGSGLTGSVAFGGVERLTADTVYNYSFVVTDNGRDFTTLITFKTLPSSGGVTVSGTVTDISQLTSIYVTLERGNTVIASVTTDNGAGSGIFSFSNVRDGIYNLVADNGKYKVTQAVTVAGSNVTGILMDMGTGKTQSVVEIKNDDTPPAAVDGLPTLFEDPIIYTPTDATIVTAGGTVEMKLALEKQDNPSTAGAINTATGSGQTIGLFLDISVIKSHLNSGGELTHVEKLSDLGAANLLTITFELPTSMTGKTVAAIYRAHGGGVDMLTKTTTPEYFEQSGNIITLHVYKFSTYALAYATVPVTPPGGNTGGGGGTTTNNVTINKDGTGSGSVTTNPTSPTSGNTVTITVLPDAGYALDKLTITDANGNAISFKDNGDGTYAYTQPSGKVTVTATFKKTEKPAKAFDPDSDVSGWLITDAHKTYVSGVGGGKFNPLADMTRAEAAQMFYNLLINKNVTITKSFPDVSANAWYTKAVNTLAKLGIITGYPDGGFHPNDKLTRAQLATIVVKFAKVSPGETRFSDVSATHWAYDYINTAANFGWATGVGGGKFAPDRNITRAEAVTLINRMLRRYPDKACIDSHSDFTFFTDVDRREWFYYDVMEAANEHDYERDSKEEFWKKED